MPPKRGTRRIAHALAAAHHARFIGRQAEVELFRNALAAPSPPFTILHVHGAGGVGKTTLLSELARQARDAGRVVHVVDGRDLQPSSKALRRAVGKMRRNSVLIIDTYEKLSALDAWLRHSYLPELPADAIVVIAGRQAPPLVWRSDPAWSALTRIVELPNFQPLESADFLSSRGVRESHHRRVLDFTRGHPLALSLVADVLAGRPAHFRFAPTDRPDIVHHLLSLFVETVPASRRKALDVCAIARVTIERLLIEVLGPEEGRDAFNWLREQSFIVAAADGLFPHDVVRELLIADARWRDDEELKRLSRRIYSITQSWIRTASAHDRQRLQMNALYVTRIRPTNKDFFDWNALDNVRVEPAEAADAKYIFDLVNRHEGPESASIARKWWRVQPDAFHVFHGADDSRFGFLALLDLAGPTCKGDPAVQAAREFIAVHGPIRRGEGAVYLRWWMHAEEYQRVTAAINLTAMHVVSLCVTHPGMAWNFVAMADPAFWSPHFEGVNFARVPSADFTVGGRRYGVFAHDWRIEPAADWMMGIRTPMPFAGSAAKAATPRLDEAGFQHAVRKALRDFTRPEILAENPLRFARIVERAPDMKSPGVAIQQLLSAAVDSLKANPGDMKLHCALWLTYFEPLENQERVAERLDLPFSTYRHHLTRGIQRIGNWLWHRERSIAPL